MMRRRPWVFLAPLVALVLSGETAAQPDAPPGEVVQLPPMIVEGSAKLPPWLYVSVPGAEYLSRCSMATTRGYVETRLARLQTLAALVPADFFAAMDVPSVTVLYSQRLKSEAMDELLRDLAESRSRARTGNSVVSAVPNMLLDDRDLLGVFAYVDEEKFDRRTLTVATDYVRLLLERRLPRLPAWLIEGVVSVYHDADLSDRPVSVRPLVWLSWQDSQAIAAHPDGPRALVSATELFAPKAFDEEAARSPRGRTLRAQSSLFVRWALDPKHELREAFWNFARDAAREPANESMFERHFGFGFSDLRDRLNDYLPEAIRSPLEIPLPKPPPLSRVDVRPATPSDVARLRGEWERIAIGFVARRHPDFTGRYREQARATLQRGYDAGDRDPRLFAAIGLCEFDAGNHEPAREFLERAVAERLVRPRAHHAVAQLRLTDLLRDRPAAQDLAAGAIENVLVPLRTAIDQAPPLPEVFALFAEAWLRSPATPPAADWQRFATGAAYFAHESTVCLQIARAFARHGKRAEAIALLARGFHHASSHATREQFAQLYQELAKAP